MRSDAKQDRRPSGRPALTAGDAATARQGGATLVLACLPIVLAAWAHGARAVLGEATVGVPTFAATILLATSALLTRGRHRGLAPSSALAAGALGAGLLLLVLGPSLVRSPEATLAAAVTTALAAHLATRRTLLHEAARPPDGTERAALRARAAAGVTGAVLLTVTTFHRAGDPLVQAGTTLAAAVPMTLALLWVGRDRAMGVRSAGVLATSATGWLLVAGAPGSDVLGLAACLAWCATGFLVRRPAAAAAPASGGLWEPVLSHPARFLVSTFFLLAVLGTILLSLPWATTGPDGIDAIDAAFTAVSAVCVTGLAVLDTPTDFTLPGQLAILLLVQVGGLGIMSITTLVLHALGRRVSLRHERLLVEMGVPLHVDLFRALRQVVLFAFGVEIAGAALLAAAFASGGEPWGAAAWRGAFTSVSAFCNAGFALQSDSLVGYQDRPLVLHVVAALIVLGGLSPAVAAGLAARLRGRPLEPLARIVLAVTAALLVGGGLAYGLFEWRGSLAGLPWPDRLHNAWFQSVTLRTAGFNSVDVAAIAPHTQLLMMSLMFVGGSPGGTAGGIKTTTFAVLLLTVWTAVTGRSRVVVAARQVGATTVFRAVAVLGTGVLVWLLVVVSLLLTQRIAPYLLVFEATSALGTVGLTLGATPVLDGAGKGIVMIGMFLGRVGPLTLFTLLAESRAPRDARYPEANVPLA